MKLFYNVICDCTTCVGSVINRLKFGQCCALLKGLGKIRAFILNEFVKLHMDSYQDSKMFATEHKKIDTIETKEIEAALKFGLRNIEHETEIEKYW